MKKYLYDYIKSIDEVISKSDNKEDIVKEHLIKIEFFQHERLIHLLVTLFYCVFMLIFLIGGMFFWPFYIAGIMLLIFVLFYIVHYFRLENGVQYLYKQYDILKKNSKK